MKAIIDNNSLSKINIKSTPMRLMRFRLVSEDRKSFSPWSIIEKVVPDDFKIIKVTSTGTHPLKISFDARTNTVSWAPTNYVGEVKDQVPNSTVTLDLHSTHGLRQGDEIFIQDEKFLTPARKQDGVYLISSVQGTEISIDFGPVKDIVEGQEIDFAYKLPANEIDIYYRLISGNTKTAYRLLSSSNDHGSATIPIAIINNFNYLPKDIEIVIQHSTVPQMVYTKNLQKDYCPVVLATATLPVARTYTRL